MSEAKNQNTLITIILCTTIVIGSTVIGAFLYNINDRNNMAKNIEAAIQKGVDPLSVKCSYEMSPTSTCIAYAMATKK
jgi:pyruvate/oxaloacetate carboxyltransferase